MKHTPGPWCIVRQTPAMGTWPAALAELGYGIWIREEDGVVDDVPSKRESLANARLIAAAPDLLAAARRLHEIVPQGPPDDWMVAMADLGKAIAKAEGK